MHAVLIGLGLLLALLPSRGAAQEAECTFTSVGRTAGTVEDGVQIVHFYDPFTVVCTDGAELRANSGRLNQSIRELYLQGNVLFQDTARTLTSNEAIYNSGTARLWAMGNVVFIDRSDGSTLRGPELEYFRATETRPIAEMTATRRPTVTIPAREGADPADPLELVADRVVIIGNDDLSAYGEVVITRPDMTATSGEARYNSATEDLELRQNAVIRNEEYELGGEVVQARLTEGALEHVHARTEASLRGEDLEVTGPEMQLFFAEDRLQRAIALGDDETLAEAFSRTFRMRADSLDARLVDQQLEEVYAVGRAFAETIDTTASASPASAGGTPSGSGLLEHDWIRGDTIIGYFEPVAAAEPEPEPEPEVAEASGAPEEVEENDRPSVELRRLLATGAAQSLYRMRAETDPPGQRSNINFLVGEQIELNLVEGELQVANVSGLQQGVYLEATGARPDGPNRAPETGSGIESPLGEPNGPIPQEEAA